MKESIVARSIAILAQEGPLAKLINGYTVRATQQQLTTAVAESIAKQRKLIAEAGTGTGKTFAYLIPALLSGVKVIVATGTKNLQDQLYQRDLPLLMKALKMPLRLALLKGRANYLCHYRIELHAYDGRFITEQALRDFEYIRSNLARSITGDIAEFSNIPESSEVWPYVTSTPDNCLGNECPQYDNCFLVKARKQAQQANFLVINHHLYFADLALKEDGFGEILPGAQVVVFDEAHQLAEIATHFFGTRFSSRQFIELGKDIRTETLLAAADQQELLDAVVKLEKAVLDLRLALGEKDQRRPWQEVANSLKVQQATAELKQTQQMVLSQLNIARERSKGLENCFERAMVLRDVVELITNATASKHILWFETFTQAFNLHATPLSIANEFSKALNTKTNYIFTSATLAVDSKFDHFANSLGLKDYDHVLLHSHFDYKNHALMYFPRGMPDIHHPEYIHKLLDHALPIVNALGGKTFFLFTSYKALNLATQLLRKVCNFPLLVQGEQAKSAILQQFRKLGNAVLLATSSFWEGVDVKGEALSCVIIDKLPFESPGDPIVRARIQQLREVGQDPFYTLQLPKAVITLKQGVGRLIRDEQDKGILMIADPRLGAREYGAQFFASLPAMTKTRDLEQVLNFLAKIV